MRCWYATELNGSGGIRARVRVLGSRDAAACAAMHGVRKSFTTNPIAGRPTGAGGAGSG